MIEAASLSCLSTLALVFDRSDVRGINATAFLDHAAASRCGFEFYAHVRNHTLPSIRTLEPVDPSEPSVMSTWLASIRSACAASPMPFSVFHLSCSSRLLACESLLRH